MYNTLCRSITFRHFPENTSRGLKSQKKILVVIIFNGVECVSRHNNRLSTSLRKTVAIRNTLLLQIARQEARMNMFESLVNEAKDPARRAFCQNQLEQIKNRVAQVTYFRINVASVICFVMSWLAQLPYVID